MGGIPNNSDAKPSCPSMTMDGKDCESPRPHQKDKSLPGHDIFCTPENSNFLSATPYKTLDPTQREIRLLKVLPDLGNGFVECELLPSAPIAELRGKYLALSYCAGDPRNTELILINGVKCNVFANLRHALTCARHFWTTQPRNGEFLLWADQICINQADLSERSHQVGFMRDIYQSAQQTLICLSTSNRHGKGMEKLLKTPNKVPKPPASLPLHRSLLVYRGPEYIEFNLPAIWKDIIESPWWKRAWVFQEFVVSTDAIFMSTNYNIHWKAAQLALERYIGPAYQPLAFDFLEFHFKRETHFQKENEIPLPDFDARGAEEAAGKVWFMLKTKAEWKDATAGLTYLLARSRNSKASEDRDRIYAFLGLADPGYAIVPDYSASSTLRDVLTETTKNIILFENTLDVLSVIAAPPLARRPGLPSWVVDWTREEIAGPPDKEYLNTLKHTPRGKGPAIASFRKATHPETRQETTIMEVTGTFVKEFESVGRSGLPFLGVVKSEVLEVWDLCGSSFKFLLRPKSYGYQIVRWASPGDLETRPKNVPKVRRSARAGTGARKLARTETAEPRVISIF